MDEADADASTTSPTFPPQGFTRLFRAADLAIAEREKGVDWQIPEYGPARHLRGREALSGEAELIRRAVENGSCSIAGRVVGSDELIWGPRETWMEQPSDPPKDDEASMSPFWLAYARGDAVTFTDGQLQAQCEPIIREADLARILGAKACPLMPLPRVEELIGTLADWTKRQTLKAAEAAGPAKAEVPPPVLPAPVPPAELLRWWLPYMAEHPDPDRRPTVAEQHEAAITHFVGRKPPTNTEMLRLRKLPQTPPEWREPGRRPKSR